MPYNGTTGVYTAPSLPGSWNPATAGSTASPTDWNTLLADFVTAYTTAICKDGQTTPTANLPMGTFKHTGVGNATARDSYAAAGQVQDNTLRYVAAGGTADAITLTLAPVVTAYVIGQTFTFKASADNATTTPTINVNGVGAGTITWPDGSALRAGDIKSGGIFTVSVQATTPVFHLKTVAGAPIKTSAANSWSATQTMSGAAFNEAVRVDVASATTADIGAAASNYVRITGTTTITGLGTIGSGTRRHVVFGGALTLTHNATSLILPGGASITTAAGDTATFESEGSGNWRCISYQKADGTAVVATTIPAGTTPIAYAYCTVSGGTVTLAKSSNITSITKSSAGAFVVTMSSAAADSNYRIHVTANFGAASILSGMEDSTTQARTTTLFGLGFFNTPVARTDPNSFSLTVYA